MNWQLRKQLSDYSVPSVLSYVQKKVAVTDLKNSLKAWERKAAVAEVSETGLGVWESGPCASPVLGPGGAASVPAHLQPP